MRLLIYIILILLLLVGCKTKSKLQSSKHPEGLIGITKTDTGYNIYSNTDELILEYTKQNCDSLSL